VNSKQTIRSLVLGRLSLLKFARALFGLRDNDTQMATTLPPFLTPFSHEKQRLGHAAPSAHMRSRDYLFCGWTQSAQCSHEQWLLVLEAGWTPVIPYFGKDHTIGTQSDVIFCELNDLDPILVLAFKTPLIAVRVSWRTRGILISTGLGIMSTLTFPPICRLPAISLRLVRLVQLARTGMVQVSHPATMHVGANS
jgi:hypothetical protein